MFLRGTDEKVIIDTGTKSVDLDGINMDLVKNVTVWVVKLFTYLAVNNSYILVYFLTKWKQCHQVAETYNFSTCDQC